VSSVIVCHACDLAHRFDRIESAARVRCVRCRAEIYRTSGASIDTAIALAVSALVLFILANAYPLIALKVNGATRVATLIGAALGLSAQGYATMSVLVLFTAVLVPLVQILAFLYVLVALRRGLRVPGQSAVYRALAALRPWAMAEVFVLAALVAMVKLAAQAEVTPRVALVAYGLLMFTLTTLNAIVSPEQFWQWIERSSR
jgi:paraquat-inducible protein A